MKKAMGNVPKNSTRTQYRYIKEKETVGRHDHLHPEVLQHLKRERES